MFTIYGCFSMIKDLTSTKFRYRFLKKYVHIFFVCVWGGGGGGVVLKLHRKVSFHWWRKTSVASPSLTSSAYRDDRNYPKRPVSWTRLSVPPCIISCSPLIISPFVFMLQFGEKTHRHKHNKKRKIVQVGIILINCEKNKIN